MPTIHDRLVAALQKRGAVLTTAVRTSKYTVLTRPGQDDHFYFVGANGALRAGRTTATSISLPGFRDSLLRLEDPARNRTKG